MTAESEQGDGTPRVEETETNQEGMSPSLSQGGIETPSSQHDGLGEYAISLFASGEEPMETGEVSNEEGKRNLRARQKDLNYKALATGKTEPKKAKKGKNTTTDKGQIMPKSDNKARKEPTLEQPGQGERAPTREAETSGQGERAPARDKGNNGQGERAPTMENDNSGQGERAPTREEVNAGQGERAPTRVETTNGQGETPPTIEDEEPGHGERAPTSKEKGNKQGERAPTRKEPAKGQGEKAPNKNPRPRGRPGQKATPSTSKANQGNNTHDKTMTVTNKRKMEEKAEIELHPRKRRGDSSDSTSEGSSTDSSETSGSSSTSHSSAERRAKRHKKEKRKIQKELNEQIAKYKKKNKELQETVDRLREKLEQKKKSNKSKENEINHLKKKADELERENQSLRKETKKVNETYQSLKDKLANVERVKEEFKTQKMESTRKNEDLDRQLQQAKRKIEESELLNNDLIEKLTGARAYQPRQRKDTEPTRFRAIMIGDSNSHRIAPNFNNKEAWDYTDNTYVIKDINNVYSEKTYDAAVFLLGTNDIKTGKDGQEEAEDLIRKVEQNKIARHKFICELPPINRRGRETERRIFNSTLHRGINQKHCTVIKMAREIESAPTETALSDDLHLTSANARLMAVHIESVVRRTINKETAGTRTKTKYYEDPAETEERQKRNEQSREEMKEVPCKFYNQGRCRRGDQCFYSHALEDHTGTRERNHSRDTRESNQSRERRDSNHSRGRRESNHSRERRESNHSRERREPNQQRERRHSERERESNEGQHQRRNSRDSRHVIVGKTGIRRVAHE